MPSMEYLSSYDLVPGKVLADRYEVVGARRQSGFSAAYEVVDRKDSKTYELSFFPNGTFERSGQAEEFRQSILPWTDLSSPHVLRVVDLAPVHGGLVLVTELPRGVSLRSRLESKGRLSSDDVRRLGVQLLEGLVTIHAANLVHGDVKPLTIHVEGEGTKLATQLVDGGIAPGLWMAKGLGEKTALIGTPYYAPVEQFGGDVADVRSDVYNVATVLYECATGVLPWSGTTFLEVFQAKMQDAPPMAQRVPGLTIDAGLDEVIRRGCRADRRKRFASAEEFLEALDT
jgi:serine/threonine protein kinase